MPPTCGKPLSPDVLRLTTPTKHVTVLLVTALIVALLSLATPPTKQAVPAGPLTTSSQIQTAGMIPFPGGWSSKFVCMSLRSWYFCQGKNYRPRAGELA